MHVVQINGIDLHKNRHSSQRAYIIRSTASRRMNSNEIYQSVVFSVIFHIEGKKKSKRKFCDARVTSQIDFDPIESIGSDDYCSVQRCTSILLRMEHKAKEKKKQ